MVLPFDITDGLQSVAHRSEILSIIVIAGYSIGSLVATTNAPKAVIRRIRNAVHMLGVRLDRPNRSAATLVYRGIIALVMLLGAALVTASIAAHPLLGQGVIPAFAAIVWFGYCFQAIDLYRMWRLSLIGKLPLELADENYLFSDTHGVIRYLLAARFEAFSVGVVGTCLWYLAGGLGAAILYLTAASAAHQYQGQAFGWAARSLFTLLDILPRMAARALLALAALFTNGTRPLRAITARSWSLFVARLMDVSLGGHSPTGEMPWVGDGTPKPTHAALRRLITLTLAATVLLVLALNTAHIYNLLIKLY